MRMRTHMRIFSPASVTLTAANEGGTAMLHNDFSAAFEETTATVNCHLRVHESFDLIVKRQRIGGRRAAFYFTEGLIKDAMLEWMLEFFCKH